jgi:hypothetical protein
LAWVSLVCGSVGLQPMRPSQAGHDHTHGPTGARDIGQHSQELETRCRPALPAQTLSRLSYQIRMPAARRLNRPPPLSMLSYAELITSEPGGG